jgi:hypothetical protein
MNCMEIGDEWIYRQRPYSPSERVRIISIEKGREPGGARLGQPPFAGGVGRAIALHGVHGDRHPIHSRQRRTEGRLTGLQDAGIIDSELRLVAAVRRPAQEPGGLPPSIDVAVALQDGRGRWPSGLDRPAGTFTITDVGNRASA